MTSRRLIALMIVLIPIATLAQRPPVQDLTQTSWARLPEAAAGAIRNEFPRFRLQDVYETARGGHRLLQATLRGPDGHLRVVVTPKGQIVTVRGRVQPAMLPGVVRRAVHKRAPDARILSARMKQRRAQIQPTGRGDDLGIEVVPLAEPSGIYRVEADRGDALIEMRINAQGRVLHAAARRGEFVEDPDYAEWAGDDGPDRGLAWSRGRAWREVKPDPAVAADEDRRLQELEEALTHDEEEDIDEALSEEEADDLRRALRQGADVEEHLSEDEEEAIEEALSRPEEEDLEEALEHVEAEED